MMSPDVVMTTSGHNSSASAGSTPRAAAMARCIIPDWVSASFEPRVPILTRGCLVTTRQIPPTTMTRHTILGIETSCDETAAAVVRLDEGGPSQVFPGGEPTQIPETPP